MDFDELNRLRRKREFYASAPDWCRAIWPRPQSFNNFCKENKDALKAEGAMRRIGRDYFVDAERFQTVAASILGLDTR